MSWYYVVLLCLVSCWFGMFLMGLLSVSKCENCNTKKIYDGTLRCQKCGTKDLHITNRFKCPESIQDYVVVCHRCGAEYEIHNNIANQ